MTHFIYNGKLLEEGTAITGPDNRGLRYGDGLFETIKAVNKKLVFVDEHFARLWKGMALMQFNIPKHFTPDKLQAEIERLLDKNDQTTARVRLSIIRGNGGLYDTARHSPEYIIQSWPLVEKDQLNDNGLQLCIYRDAKKVIDAFSNLKHNNYLPYFMGALYAKSMKCNDAIILNNHDRICDSTIANIFIVKDRIIYTPQLEEGCVAGVFRKFMITHLINNNYTIQEQKTDEAFLKEADEVFLTNSIYNMRWVQSINERSYTNNTIRGIYSSLPKTFI